MNRVFISYASSFVSTLFDHTVDETLIEIENIILFGSGARGKTGKKSDVDIFINVPSEKKNIHEKVQVAVSFAVHLFYDSLLFKKYWKPGGMENEIKCIVGRLDDWEDLKPSIISDGILLYGKYSGAVNGTQSFVIISWKNVKPETKRVLLSKKLYGYNMNGKRYAGVTEGTLTTKLGSNCIMVPIQSSKRILSVFDELGVDTIKFHMNSIV